MKISVIIPAYNEENNLPKVIKSLQVNNSKNFEIIVVDNNSKDNTFGVAKALADKVYKYKKQGSTYARNYAAKKSKSEIIAFLDADSVAFPNWIDLINNAFENNKDLSLISGLGLFENKNSLKRVLLYVFSYTIFFYNKTATWFGKPMLIANNLAIKRDVFNKVGGFDHYIVEDYYLSLKLKKLDNVISKIDGKMKVEYSSRRIDKIGLLSTWKVWFVSIFKKIPFEEYVLHDKL